VSSNALIGSVGGSAADGHGTNLRPRVIHLTSVHDAHDTRILLKQCRTLARRGFDVMLIAPHDRDEVVDGVRIRAVRMPAGRAERFTRTITQVLMQALREPAQLYHVHDPELLPVAQLLRMSGKRVIYDMHENVPAALRTKIWIPRLLRSSVARAYAVLERLLLLRIPVVFAEASYETSYPRVHDHALVRNFPRLDDAAPSSEPKYPVPTVGYIGGVLGLRGAVVTAAALRLLERRGRSVDWECVGPVHSSCGAELDQLAADFGGDRIRLRGRMPLTDGLPLIGRCHVGLALLQPVPNYVDSYPTKVFEYMALGLPVVASNFPLYRDLIEQTGCGVCVDPENEVEVAAAIERLIADPEEAAAMGRRGRSALAARFSWDTEAQNLLALYGRVMGQLRRRA
jgi:glycosyltransferase involved in cell wall biosynthesis